MAATIYIDFKTIPGASIDKAFLGKVKLNSFSFAASKKLTEDPGNTKRTDGPASLGNITCTKDLDVATASLYQYCLLGTEMPSVELTFGDVNSKGEFVKTVTYTLGKVYFSSVQTSGSGSVPSETFSLDYVSMKCAYEQQGSDGNKKGVSGFTYDRANGTAVIS